MIKMAKELKKEKEGRVKIGGRGEPDEQEARAEDQESLGEQERLGKQERLQPCVCVYVSG